jgi:hypothetical protein
VSAPAGADGCHPCPGCDKFLVSVSDLTGPLAARQSAEVSQEQEDVRIGGPQIPEPMHAVR